MKPCLRCIISGILGRKYLGLFRSLLSFLKSLPQQTLPSFLGIINVENAHLLRDMFSRTSLFMRWLSSLRNTVLWVWAIGYKTETLKCHAFVFWRFRDTDRRNMQLIFSIFPKKIAPFTNILQMAENVVWVSPVKCGTNFSIYHHLNLNWHTIKYNTSLKSLCFHLYGYV